MNSLGKGTFAEVHRAVELATGNMRAIKVGDRIYDVTDREQQIVKHRFEGNQKTLTLFQREINICSTLEHVSLRRQSWRDR
jgi:serine/threonine protein kinase